MINMEFYILEPVLFHNILKTKALELFKTKVR